MLTIQSKLNHKLLYPIQGPYNIEDILFFDIETTGLSAKTSYLYLIGCIYFENDSWQIIQWFADEMNNEVAILDAFFQKVKNYKRIVHYNGSGFDIPFIQNKCKQHNIVESFDQIESFDIYKKLLPYKNLLPVDNLKLKSVESFLGIKREDTYSGADLIQVYANYLGSNRYEKLHQSKPQMKKDNSNLIPSSEKITWKKELPSSNKIPASKELLQILLLHNAEDVEGLLSISNILCYIDIFDCNIYKHIFLNICSDIADSQKNWNVEIISNIETQTNYLKLEVTIPFEIPRSVHWENKLFTSTDGTFNTMFIHLIASSNNITLKVPIFKGELKYFFPNYKDYYYLPKEDMAIHKSVAQFVDKEYRTQAKANNCYSKKAGIFIPTFDKNVNNVFKADYHDSIDFIELDMNEIAEPINLYEYVTHCVDYLHHTKETYFKNIK